MLKLTDKKKKQQKTHFTSYHKKGSCYSIFFTKVISKGDDMYKVPSVSECNFCMMCIWVCVCGIRALYLFIYLFNQSINNYQPVVHHNVQTHHPQKFLQLPIYSDHFSNCTTSTLSHNTRNPSVIKKEKKRKKKKQRQGHIKLKWNYY